MTDQGRTQAGWYPHPSMPGTRGYWDGEKWTDHVAPVAPEAETRRSSWSVLVIAGGILLAAVVIWFAYSLATANDDLDCATQNADRATDGQAPIDCD